MIESLWAEGNGSDRPLPKPNVVVPKSGTPPHEMTPEAVKGILNLALQICANLTIVFEPFLPFTSERLRNMLKLDSMAWEDATSLDNLKEGHQIEEPSLLFEKVEDEIMEEQVQKLHG